MTKAKDNIFATTKPVKPFQFNEDVARVFDDMIQRSVPGYQQVQEQILSLVREFCDHPKKIYDLGCSTGQLLFFLARHLDLKSCQYVGIDKAECMIEKASENLKGQNLMGSFKFVTADVFEQNYGDGDVLVLNYVLQFLSPEVRQEFLTDLYKSLKPGAMLIVSEKTQSFSKNLSQGFSSIYEKFKMNHHYSQLEVAQKRKALENVLMPFDFEENLTLLKQSGFDQVAPFFTWFNFASYVAIKENKER